MARRPRLWPAGIRAYATHVPSRWWRAAPFLPVPARDWIRFRLQTAYGDPTHPPTPEDVVAWLEWSRGWKALSQ